MRALAGLILTACLACLAYMHVWHRVQMLKLGYEIADRERMVEELAKERRLLRLEYSRVSSFERLSGGDAGDLWDSASSGFEIVEVLVPRNSKGRENGPER